MEKLQWLPNDYLGGDGLASRL